MSASLIGHSGSSVFRLSTTTVSMSLTGSCVSSEIGTLREILPSVLAQRTDVLSPRSGHLPLIDVADAANMQFKSFNFAVCRSLHTERS